MQSEPSSETTLRIRLIIDKSKNLEYNFKKIEEISKALIAELSPESYAKEQLLRSNLEKVKEGGWAKGQMIVRNQGLVRKLAMTHSSQYVTQDDLIQQGNEGLIRAVEKFDPNMGNKFSTYAGTGSNKQSTDTSMSSIRSRFPNIFVTRSCVFEKRRTLTFRQWVRKRPYLYSHLSAKCQKLKLRLFSLSNLMQFH